MIQTIELVKEYNGNKAVDGASVRIENGNIYGLIGKNGAGKTTFIRMISGKSAKQICRPKLLTKIKENYIISSA